MAYEIPINTSSLDAVIAKFKEAAEASERLNGSVTANEQAMRGMARAGGSGGGTGGGSGAPGGGGGFGRGRGPNNRVYDIARGAEQQYDVASRRLQQAEATGNATLIADARANLIRQERARARQREMVEGSATHGNAVWDAFMTSRVGPGGKLYPLVNRLRAAGFGTQEELQAHFANQGLSPAAAAKAAQAAAESKVANTAGALQNLGVSAATAGKMAPSIVAAASLAARIASAALPMLGPVGLAAGAAAVGYGLASKAADTQRSAASAYFSTGSSPADVARIRGLAGFAGKDPGSAVDSLAAALHNGSYGAAVLNSRGIVDMGSFTRDRGANYINAIKALRGMKEGEAIRVARDVGMTDELRMRYLSDDGMKALENANRPRTEAEMRAAVDFEAKGQQFGAAWNDTITNLGNMVLPAMTGFVDFFNPKNWAEMWDDKPAAKSGGKKAKSDAVDANTEAVNNLTRILGGQKEIIGGGFNSRHVIPAGLKYQSMQSSIQQQAIMLGAYAL